MTSTKPDGMTVQSNRAIREGNASSLSALFVRLYPRLRSRKGQAMFRSWVAQIEGGAAFSITIREILRKYYRLNVGLYTAGPCRVHPRVYQPVTTIGRYCSIEETVRTFTRNHTTNTKSTHGFFDNPVLGKVKTDLIPWGSLSIGNGVWMGHNAIILPPTTTIGDGAVIRAGSVVYGNVPPYAIVAGFPARIMGFRFSKDVIAALLASRWWEKPLDELVASREQYAALIQRQPDNSEKREPAVSAPGLASRL